MADSLESEVFTCIIKRLQGRRSDLFTLTGCTGSFEEWCNWEAYIACKGVADWYTIAKPKYGGKGGFDVTHPEYKNCFGDLAVSRTGPDGVERWVFAEFALLHDGNCNTKWQEKIAADVEKLRSIPFVNDIRLLIVLASSHRQIDIDNAWISYLAGIPVWQRPTMMSATIQLEPRGCFVARAFNIHW